MKKTYILVMVVLVLVTLLLWFFMGSQQSPRAVTQDQIQQNAEMMEETEGDTLRGRDTFANLFKLNRPLECAFTYEAEDIRHEGNVFVDGKKSRVESMYQDDAGMMFASSMITDGEMMYMWGSSPQGEMAIKMRVPDATTQNTQAPTKNQNPIDPNTAVDYSCESWRVDGSIFVPPTDVQFIDMDEMMKGMGDMMRDVEGFQIPTGQAQ
jgi:hypothetical protein